VIVVKSGCPVPPAIDVGVVPTGSTVVNTTTDVQMAESAEEDGDEDAAVDPLDERYLQVINDTDKPVDFVVQYYTKNDSGRWAWFPVSPRRESRGVVFEIAAGDTTYLSHKGRKLSASRIRFWVKSADGQYEEYRHKDLWLVPEMDSAGNHVYFAPEMDTFPLRLTP
jgi:hypothetical protein